MSDIKDMLTAQLAHQDELNSVIDPQWATRRNNWQLAIMLEAAECIEHTNWKWWSKTQTDEHVIRQRIEVEIADMWHFVLSMCIEHGVKPSSLRGAVNIAYVDDTSLTIVQRAKSVIETCLRHTGAFYIAFVVLELAAVAGVSFTRLHELHTAKYVLNKFRQEHGYKEGTYRKTWYDGREDNDHLQDALQTYRDNDHPFSTYALEEYLRGALTVRYERTFHNN